jgi:drug/metabolite transporter (DMT)-like permease
VTISSPAGASAFRGTLLLLAAAIVWSTNGLFIKELQATGLSGMTIAGLRSLVAAICLAPIAVLRWRPVADRDRLPTLVTVLLFTIMSATFVIATTMTTAANAIILQYTAPAWVFVLSPFIVGERASARQWIAFVAAMGAVAFIFTMQFNTDRLGLLIGLASGLIFGTQVVFFRRVRAVDPVALTAICCAVSAVVLTAIALRTGLPALTARMLILLFVTGALQFALGYVLYAAGNRLVTAQTAILIVMLEPILNPVWVYLFRGEIPHWSTLAGGGLILAAVTYLSLLRD